MSITTNPVADRGSDATPLDVRPAPLAGSMQAVLDAAHDPFGDLDGLSGLAAMGGGHGPLSCADVEAVLAETSTEHEALRDQIAMMERVDAARQQEMDTLRLEATRIRAVLTDTRKSMARLDSERSGMDSQIKILTEELEAAERDAVPMGTLTHAAIPTAAVTSLYRSISGISRGPLPPTVLAAVTEALPALVQAMEEAGRAALDQVVRTEVRRRRAQSSAARAARPRAAATPAAAHTQTT